MPMPYSTIRISWLKLESNFRSNALPMIAETALDTSSTKAITKIGNSAAMGARKISRISVMISATVAMPIIAIVLLSESALSMVLETLPLTP